MRVERTMMAADVTVGLTSNRGPATSTAAAARPAPGVGTGGPGGRPRPAAALPAPVEAAPNNARQAPVMPGLSASDRAAIASATGFYITASGKVTPEGMPPWGFIVRYVEQRQAERQADPAAGVDAGRGHRARARGRPRRRHGLTRLRRAPRDDPAGHASYSARHDDHRAAGPADQPRRHAAEQHPAHRAVPARAAEQHVDVGLVEFGQHLDDVAGEHVAGRPHARPAAA